jgi:hypothetical protein
MMIVYTLPSDFPQGGKENISFVMSASHHRASCPGGKNSLSRCLSLSCIALLARCVQEEEDQILVFILRTIEQSNVIVSLS